MLAVAFVGYEMVNPKLAAIFGAGTPLERIDDTTDAAVGGCGGSSSSSSTC
eukprot:SAG22_NODE_16440_length_325_cov_0.853982_1_plen_50_part_01